MTTKKNTAIESDSERRQAPPGFHILGLGCTLSHDTLVLAQPTGLFHGGNCKKEEMKVSNKEVCENCKFFTSDTRECRRYPPTIAPGGIWPTIPRANIECCGEFKKGKGYRALTLSVAVSSRREKMATSDVRQRAQEIAHDLLGTCEATPDEVYEVDGLAEQLDDIVFLCEGCGWWCEIGDVDDSGDGLICTDCFKA